MVIRITALAGLLFLLAAAACSDDPFAIRWIANPDTVVLFSLDRPELNIPSGFNFVNRNVVRIEAPATGNRWDMAVDSDGVRMFLLPPGALGVQSRARIATVPGASFDEVTRAPTDTLRYSTDTPVEIQTGNVYVVQTREDTSGFGRRCVFYAKLEPLEIDPVEGVLTFVFDVNPACNDGNLVPRS